LRPRIEVLTPGAVLGRPERGFCALCSDISRDNGIGAFTIQILDGLARVAPDEHGTAIALRASTDLDVPPGWTLHRARGRLDFALRAFVSAVRHRPEEIVVLHLSFMSVAFVAARLASARLTLVVHGWEMESTRRRLDRWCGYRADRIVANSRLTALEVERFFRDKRAHHFGAVQLLHPTWDPRNSTGDPTRRAVARDALGFDQDELILLTVGRMDSSEQYKGHDRVLDVLPALLASHPNLRYLVVGQGNDRERLARRALALGVAHRVTFAGYREDLADYYTACDLYVMPSTHEGFGIVFLEALASGRPVVAGGIDGSIEAVDWGELGFLCDPLIPASVEGAIRRAIDGLGSGDPRVDATFLRTQVERRFGAVAFDESLAELFSRRTTRQRWRR
jgi:glycosyltransferase involved in cell wall biosynthesis